MALETVWTETLQQQLAQLWKEGFSTAEIGRKLGISKNAVVGKAHRLNLPARPSPIKLQAPRPEPRPAPPPPVHVVPLREKGPVCQWPNGHPGQPGFHFCGKPSIPGKPYCSEHAARAYIPGSGKARSDAA